MTATAGKMKGFGGKIGWMSEAMCSSSGLSWLHDQRCNLTQQILLLFFFFNILPHSHKDRCAYTHTLLRFSFPFHKALSFFSIKLSFIYYLQTGDVYATWVRFCRQAFVLRLATASGSPTGHPSLWKQLVKCEQTFKITRPWQMALSKSVLFSTQTGKINPGTCTSAAWRSSTFL